MVYNGNDQLACMSAVRCFVLVGGGERSGVGTGIVVIRIGIAVTYMYSH